MAADVSTHSLEYGAMLPYWDKVSAIMGGAETMRKASAYLPKYPNESVKDYNFRLANAKFTNVFRDICENLASKPFSEELKISADAPEELKLFSEDVDGEGNHIHLFAGDMFFQGIANSVHWLFVDYPKTEGTLRTQADEKMANARPYWLSIPARAMLAAETVKMGAKVYWKHIRFRADVVERDGFKEINKERIRQYDWDAGVVTFKVWEKQTNGGLAKWVELPELGGTMTIDEIPLVMFRTGRPNGGVFKAAPMLQDAADLQIELFQQESGLKYAKEATAFPMLAGNGVEPPMSADGKSVASVPVGPKSVLYAPPNGDGNHGAWAFIEPNATSLRFLADDVKETINQLRELGRQPLTAQTGNLTVVTTAFAAQKGNSAVKAAALILKDALENAFRLTAKMIGQEDTVEVEIFSDFDIATNDTNGPQTLIDARKNGDLSRATFWNELQRRNVLSANFDADEEEKALEEELPGQGSAQDILDAGVITAGSAG